MVPALQTQSLANRQIKVSDKTFQTTSPDNKTAIFCPFCFCLLSRLSGDAREKKNFISWCQEAGILEVLPYHECDRLSRDQPDYLTCLVRLQVQNVSARYPIFITGETKHCTGSAFVQAV